MANLTKAQREHMRAQAEKIQARDASQLREFFGAFDVGEFTARARSVEMVNIIADMAANPENELAFRVECAKEVLDRAWGKTQPKFFLQELNPNAPVDPAGKTVAVHINSAVAQTQRMVERQKYIGRPLEEWPAWVLAETDPEDMAVWESMGRDAP